MLKNEHYLQIAQAQRRKIAATPKDQLRKIQGKRTGKKNIPALRDRSSPAHTHRTLGQRNPQAEKEPHLRTYRRHKRHSCQARKRTSGLRAGMQTPRHRDRRRRHTHHHKHHNSPTGQQHAQIFHRPDTGGNTKKPGRRTPKLQGAAHFARHHTQIQDSTGTHRGFRGAARRHYPGHAEQSTGRQNTGLFQRYGARAQLQGRHAETVHHVLQLRRGQRLHTAHRFPPLPPARYPCRCHSPDTGRGGYYIPTEPTGRPHTGPGTRRFHSGHMDTDALWRLQQHKGIQRAGRPHSGDNRKDQRPRSAAAALAGGRYPEEIRQPPARTAHTADF